MRPGENPHRTRILCYKTVSEVFTQKVATRDMQLYQFAIEHTLKAIQGSADSCARIFSSYRTEVSYKVLYIHGVQYPWRLIETLELKEPQTRVLLKRKMHCFETHLLLRKSISERILWKTRDRAFMAVNLGQTRKAVGNTQGLTQAEAAKEALDAIDRDLGAIEQEREQLRSGICLTQASRVVDMLRSGPSK